MNGVAESRRQTAAMPALTAVIGAGQCSIQASGPGSFDFTIGPMRVAGFGRPQMRTGDGFVTAGHPAFAAVFADIWAREGVDLPRHLSGDYVLIAWHAHDRRALIPVDRFGTHALYWCDRAGRLAVSTRPIEVAEIHGEPPEIDDQALFAYLHFHMIPAPMSVVRGVRRVEMGSALHWTDGHTSETVYWQPAFEPDPDFSFTRERSQFFSALRAGMADSVAGVDPDEVGCFLSGGTDSSTLAGIACEVLQRPIKTFAIVFDEAGADERVYSRCAAAHFGTRHTEQLMTPGLCAEVIPSIVSACEQPFGNASAVPTHVCAALAGRHGVRRMIGGDGGDELFGGNTRYATAWLLSHYAKLPDGLRRGLIEPALRIGHRPPGADDATVWPLRKLRGYVDQARVPLPDQFNARYNLLNRLGVPNLLAEGFRARIDAAQPGGLERQVWQRADPGDALIDQLLRYDFKFTLADNDLVKVTRMCEVAGVAAAFPMLSDPLVNLSLRLPAAQKLHRMRLRVFFRSALRGYLPDLILDKPKHGFAMPFGQWLLSDPGLSRLAFDALDGLVGRGFLNPAFITLIRSRTSGADAGYFGTMVWVLMMLELWLRRSPFAHVQWTRP